MKTISVRLPDNSRWLRSAVEIQATIYRRQNLQTPINSAARFNSFMVMCYKPQYHAFTATKPSQRRLPQFSPLLSNGRLGREPLSCQRFLRSSYAHNLRAAHGPLRVFVEVSIHNPRPLMQMRRALRMAQALTEAVGEDPSKVKLYKAKIPELSLIAEKVKRSFLKASLKHQRHRNYGALSEPVLQKVLKETGLMFVNRNRMYVIEAPEVWLNSPFLLSVFSRLIRDAMFKSPPRLQGFVTGEDFLMYLQEWEGLEAPVKTWERAMHSVVHAACAYKALSLSKRSHVWEQEGFFWGGVNRAGIDNYWEALPIETFSNKITTGF